MIEISPFDASNWDAARAIYLQGIATGNATFQTEATTWEAWNAGHLSSPRLVARDEDRILGWAALSRVSARPVYAGVTEVSIYIAEDARGEGVGSALLAALVAASEAAGIWTLQAGIFPENEASLALHQKFGFRIVGRRERMGQLRGVWRDVLLLERRSQTVGVD
jgi:L-amino acid N-acyltransferase YncA